MGSFLREVFITLLIALVFFLGINDCVMNSEVRGPSMQPTLSTGERLFINKLAYKFGHLPQRGDIIVFIPPSELNSDKDYIKRIIGLPGEVVEITGGTVYIHKTDGLVIKLDEPYVAAAPTYNYTSPVIPPDNYFVMGDNRNNSSDSHTGWTMSRSNIVGRAWWVIWPFSKFGAAPNYKLPE